MRHPSIDLLRTIALVVMVVVHFAENLSGVIPPITGLGAPLFTFLSGLSYRLWLNGQLARDKSEDEISKVSVRRGLFVFGIGMAFNVLVWLPEDTYNWDVLTFIGIALLALNGLRRLPLPVVALIAALSLLASPVLRHLADYNAYWSKGYFEGDLTLTDQLVGLLVTGYFPVFPWICYSATGFVVGSILFDGETDESPPSPWWLALAGILMMGVAAALWGVRSSLPEIVATRLLGGWTMFPPTVTYVLGTLGLDLTLLGLLRATLDERPAGPRTQRLLTLTQSISRHAFTIYLLHHVAHLWPLWIYAIATGAEPTAYWQNAMSNTTAYALAAAFLVLCALSLRWLDPDDRRGIEAWMRWLCD